MVAAAILTAIPELFRPLMTWRMVFYGLALVLTMVLRPGGLLGTWELSIGGTWKAILNAVKAVRSRRFTTWMRRPPTDAGGGK